MVVKVGHGLAPVHLSWHNTDMFPIFAMCLHHVGSSAPKQWS